MVDIRFDIQETAMAGIVDDKTVHEPESGDVRPQPEDGSRVWD